jgi:ketosteroid isomerase-like protein
MVRLSYGMAAAALAALSACASLAGSQPAGPDVRTLVFEAERAFAVTSQTEGVRQGFLSVLADDSIVFGPAGIVSGIERYSDAPESPFSLMWWPSEGGGASSGDLYFSTGPFVVAADGEDRGFGQYLSVWQRQDDGAIRLLADHGISLPADLVGPQHAAFSALLADTRATRPAPASSCDTSLEDADAALNLAEDTNPEAVLLRNGRVSTRGPVSGRAAGVVTRKLAVAAAEDLGMSAGQAQPASAGTAQTYLRIWQREGCAWTVLIDLET